jgi:hypothetical protein
MPTLVSSLAAVAAVAALSSGAAGLTSGTAVPADAAVAPAAAVSVLDNRPPPPPPHRFHARFLNLKQCQAQARHDHPNRPGDWDCRRGHDKKHPWEYWGR